MWVPQWELMKSTETLHTSPFTSPAYIETEGTGSPGQLCIPFRIGTETSIHGLVLEGAVMTVHGSRGEKRAEVPKFAGAAVLAPAQVVLSSPDETLG